MAAMMALAGCTSVQIATPESLNNQKLAAGPEQNVAHVNASTWGLYCLSIPLLTGDSDKENSIAVCQDTVNVKTMAALATRKGKEMGGTKSLDMVSSATTVWIMPFLVIFYKSVEVSANAVK